MPLAGAEMEDGGCDDSSDDEEGQESADEDDEVWIELRDNALVIAKNVLSGFDGAVPEPPTEFKFDGAGQHLAEKEVVFVKTGEGKWRRVTVSRMDRKDPWALVEFGINEEVSDDWWPLAEIRRRVAPPCETGTQTRSGSGTRSSSGGDWAAVGDGGRAIGSSRWPQDAEGGLRCGLAPHELKTGEFGLSVAPSAPRTPARGVDTIVGDGYDSGDDWDRGDADCENSAQKRPWTSVASPPKGSAFVHGEASASPEKKKLRGNNKHQSGLEVRSRVLLCARGYCYGNDSAK